MKKRLLGAAFTALSLFSIVHADDVLRIATEGAYPPFNNMTADGKLVGFDVDIANVLCAAMERQCEIVAQDWDGIIPGLVNNKYDAIIASMSITEERLEAINFSSPYYSNYLSIIGTAETKLDMDSLGKVAFGAQRSTVGSQWSEEKYGTRADLRLYDTNLAAVSDLEAGRIEAVVMDFLPGADFVKKNPELGFITRKIDIDDKIGIGIRKGEDDLTEAFNAALKAIRDDGTYKAISVEYFGTDIF